MPLGLTPNALMPVTAKTASYQIVREDIGKVFTNRGASTITFTLPVNPDVESGWWCRVFAAADATLTVASFPTDTMITKNDATADSVALSTSSEKAGGGFEFVYDGTGWLTFMFVAETQTITVATA